MHVLLNPWARGVPLDTIMVFISVSHTNAIMRIRAAGRISDISVTLCAARVTHLGEIQLAVWAHFAR